MLASLTLVVTGRRFQHPLLTPSQTTDCASPDSTQPPCVPPHAPRSLLVATITLLVSAASPTSTVDTPGTAERSRKKPEPLAKFYALTAIAITWWANGTSHRSLKPVLRVRSTVGRLHVVSIASTDSSTRKQISSVQKLCATTRMSLLPAHTGLGITSPKTCAITPLLSSLITQLAHQTIRSSCCLRPVLVMRRTKPLLNTSIVAKRISKTAGMHVANVVLHAKSNLALFRWELNYHHETISFSHGKIFQPSKSHCSFDSWLHMQQCLNTLMTISHASSINYVNQVNSTTPSSW